MKTYIIEINTDSGDHYWFKTQCEQKDLAKIQKKIQKKCWNDEGGDPYSGGKNLDVYYAVGKVFEFDEIEEVKL